MEERGRLSDSSVDRESLFWLKKKGLKNTKMKFGIKIDF
jgi:hypothetical protein